MRRGGAPSTWAPMELLFVFAGIALAMALPIVAVAANTDLQRR